MPQQGRDAQEDGVLRETDVVGAGFQQDLQLGQALRGQPRLEDRLAGGLDTELLSAEPLGLTAATLTADAEERFFNTSAGSHVMDTAFAASSPSATSGEEVA